MSAGPFAVGRTCALAVAGGRDLARVAARYESLFPDKSFDAGVYGSLAMAGAFGSPSSTPDELRVINRASLLLFAVDRLIDEEAGTREQVAAVAAGCLTERPEDSPLAAFVADLRAELGAPAALEAAWQDQLGRLLRAMAQEWEWSRGEGEPDIEAYLANADSCGALFVAVSHWIRTGAVTSPDDLLRLRPAGEAVQRYLRLLNDVATRRRESRSGDVNIFTLGWELDDVNDRMTELAGQAAGLIEPLRAAYPGAAEYLTWQVHYSAGFYGVSDFWATA